MYPISNEVKALFESEQKQILRITGGEKSPISKSVGPSAVASFADAYAADALDVAVSIEPVQDLNGYDNPWPAGGGKNLLNLVDGTYTVGITGATAVVANGSITITGDTTRSGGRTTRLSNYFILKAGTYISSPVVSSPYIRGYLNKRSDDSAISYTTGRPFTLTEDTEVYYGVGLEDGKTYNVTIYPQVESGSTITSWAPYSNICPISGWTGAKVTRCGKNLLAFNGTSSTGQGITWAANSNGTFTANGTSTAFSAKVCGKVNLRKGVTYRVSGSIRDKINAYLYKSGLGIIGGMDTGSGVVYTPTENIDSVDFYVAIPGGRTVDNLTCYPMLSVGADAVDWEPYTAETYDITFPSEAGTVYGGTLDVTTGLLTVTHGYIASYNGESLPGRWISSMDVYSAGGTPTTSAQVVYELATPQTYQLTPTQIALLAGVNNVWADCGDVTVEYATGYEYEISITDANVMENGFTIDRYSCNGTKLEVGTAIASELTLKLDNRQGQFDGIAFEGAELFVEVGIADWTQESPTVSWMPCGYFTPYLQPRKYSTITLAALDRMMRFDRVVEDGSLTLPATVAGLVAQVCALFSVTLAAAITGLPNASYSVSELPKLQQTITYRNLIQWCAGIMGTNAWMDWNGQLRFSWYDNATGYETTAANRFSSDLHEDDITITGIQYTNTQDATIIAGTDDYALDLTGNYLAAPGIAAILPTLNTALNGFTYRPFTATVTRAPYLWPMDAITFTEKDGTSHASVLTNVNFSLNGVTALESHGETAETNSGTAPSGVTPMQGFLIEKAKQAAIDDVDESLTQEEIFNRLTDNGTAQGLYIDPVTGQIYVNASYIRSGTLILGGLNNQNGLLEVQDASGTVFGTLNKDGFTFTRTEPLTSLKQDTILKEGAIKFYANDVLAGGIYANYQSGFASITFSTDRFTIQSQSSDTPIMYYSNGMLHLLCDLSSINDITTTGDLTVNGKIYANDINLNGFGVLTTQDKFTLSDVVLASGRASLGSIAAGARGSSTISFTSVGTTNYMVVLTPLVGEISCGAQNKTATSFDLYYKNTDTASDRAGTIDWAIIKLP